MMSLGVIEENSIFTTSDFSSSRTLSKYSLCPNAPHADVKNDNINIDIDILHIFPIMFSFNHIDIINEKRKKIKMKFPKNTLFFTMLYYTIDIYILKFYFQPTMSIKKRRAPESNRMGFIPPTA